MSQLFKFDDHITMQADYRTPDPHRHLAMHLIFSLGTDMKWQIGGDSVFCRGVCIAGNILHTGRIPSEGSLVVLLTPASRYYSGLSRTVLGNSPFTIIDAEIVSRITGEFFSHPDSFTGNDDWMFSLCGIRKNDGTNIDSRIANVLSCISNLETITPHIMEKLRDTAALSESRLSHLFHQQTGMTLHSYLAFEKLQKTWLYVYQGASVTDGCLMAGFDTPSHCAATIKNLFGLSMRDIFKTMVYKNMTANTPDYSE